MKILLSGASDPFAFVLSSALRKKHEIRLTDTVQIETDFEFVTSKLDHDETTDHLVKDVDVLICLPYSPRAKDHETDWIDVTTRRQYNLLSAAATANVSQIIAISTLDLMTPYDKDMTVTEDWKPLPSTDPEILGAHLTEFVAREFAHSNTLNVTILRLGHLIQEQGAEDEQYDPMWIEESDAAVAISLLIEQDFLPSPPQIPYRVLHLQSVSKFSRFSSQRTCDLLDFIPQQGFEKNQ
ncbi:MAG: NAD(P)-dependent oxidoreductase [Candidatus Latescibacterota bacterium]|nr:NAD(P)-dependent oxidoreductase [Candidatus Latescibacterota bacterium]